MWQKPEFRLSVTLCGGEHEMKTIRLFLHILHSNHMGKGYDSIWHQCRING